VPAELPEWVPAARRAAGDRIRARRLHQDMTQEMLAQASGLDRSTIQRMEAGAEIKLSHLLMVAHALRVHVVDLLHG